MISAAVYSLCRTDGSTKQVRTLQCQYGPRRLRISDLTLPDIKLVALTVHGDERGSFIETFREADWAPLLNGARFIQDNQSRSAAAGTVRGLHYQLPPFAQAKLVRVVSGRILDVAVDLRHGSPSFGRHTAVELGDDGAQIFVPAGFAHGLMTLVPDTIVAYKVTANYDPKSERGVAWDDPDLGIAWPKLAAILSPRDRTWPRLKDQRDLL
jgi:dTDP-4-dehydrorhamnose 3,5-epimerase